MTTQPERGALYFLDISGGRPEPEIVFDQGMEGIGLALDMSGERAFVAELAGSVYTASPGGANRTTLLAAQGNLTRHRLHRRERSMTEYQIERSSAGRRGAPPA